MSIITSPMLLGADVTGPYQISRSLRFNSADSAYLSRTPSVAGSRKTFTFSCWAKIGQLGSQRDLFSAAESGTSNPRTDWRFDSSNNLTIEFNPTGGSWITLTSAAVFRDASAWYHVVVAVDTTQATSSDRTKVYVNGVQQAMTGSYVSQNTDLPINNTWAHSIGRYQAGTTSYFDGYLADVFFCDGNAYDPSYFTTTDATTGQLIPKAFSGTYGTNGWHLDFADNSAATATTLGKDSSGNGNNWTPNNFSVLSGTGNYSQQWTGTLYPDGSQPYQGGKLGGFDGNKAIYSVANTGGATATWTGAVPFASQLRLWWYMDTAAVTYKVYGATSTYTITTPASWSTQQAIDVSSIGSPLTKIEITSSGSNSGGFSGIEVDGNLLLDYRAGKNNDSLVDSPTNYDTDTGVGGEVRGNYCTWNPLQNGGLTLSNGNLDSARATSSFVAAAATIGMSSGKWYWEHTCSAAQDSANITAIGIGTSNVVISTMPGFTGGNGWVYVSESGYKWFNGSGVSYGATWTNGDVVGIAFDADAGTLTFYKNGTSQGTAYTSLTSGPYFPVVSMYGTSTGSTNFGQRQFAYTSPAGYKALCTTNLPAPLVTKPSTVFDVALDTGANILTAAQNKLSTGTDLLWIKDRANVNNHQLIDTVRGGTATLQSNTTATETTYSAPSGSSVAWCWDAGTSTVTNTSGSISSQVRANASAGFSIVTYTGTGSAGTVGHGLGVPPQMVIVKSRTVNGTNWYVYHTSVPAASSLQLNLVAAATSTPTVWNSTSPSSTVFTIGTYVHVNQNTADHVAYCFAPVASYSAFGSYTGNGNLDGPFVYTGHRSRWILIKPITQSTSWVVYDTARNTYNLTNGTLSPDLSANESGPGVAGGIDILSNGFKLRSTDQWLNYSGSDTYLYYSVAESPFQYARAR